MTSQKLREHVGQIASCTNREAYEWRGSTVMSIYLRELVSGLSSSNVKLRLFRVATQLSYFLTTDYVNLYLLRTKFG